MSNYGSWDGAWVGTGIASQPTHPVRTTPGTPPPPCTELATPRTLDHVLNKVVGLKSVAQLT